jgi:hypothetical protein
MLDPKFTVEKKEATDYTPLPENMYTVELFDIDSEKRPTYDTRNNPDETKEYETVFSFHFVLLDGEENGKSLRGRSVWNNFVPSYLYISNKHGKNRLYEIVEALQKQTVSPQQEAEGITGQYLNSLVGKQTRIATENQTKGDKTYTQIVKFYQLSQNLDPLTKQEKVDATPKPKDEKAEQVANEQYDGITADDIPFNNQK